MIIVWLLKYKYIPLVEFMILCIQTHFTVCDKFFRHFKSWRNLLFGTSPVTLIYLTKLHRFFVSRAKLRGFSCSLSIYFTVWMSDDSKCLWKCVSGNAWDVKGEIESNRKKSGTTHCFVSSRTRITPTASHHICDQFDFSVFSFIFEMLTPSKWVSLDITRTHQLNCPGVRRVYWSRAYLVAKFEHPSGLLTVRWWIPSAMPQKMRSQ